MLFETLVEDQLREDLKPMIHGLIEEKKARNELDLIDKIDVLNQYIDENIDHLEVQAQDSLAKNDNTWEPLNEFFLKIIDTH